MSLAEMLMLVVLSFLSIFLLWGQIETAHKKRSVDFLKTHIDILKSDIADQLNQTIQLYIYEKRLKSLQFSKKKEQSDSYLVLYAKIRVWYICMS